MGEAGCHCNLQTVICIMLCADKTEQLIKGPGWQGPV